MKIHGPKKILIISYHFYPDTEVGARRPTKFMESLIEAGYQVDVLTKYQEVIDVKYQHNKFYFVKEYQDPINAAWAVIKYVLNLFTRKKSKRVINGHVKKTNECISNAQLPGSIRSRLRRYIISYQSLLSGKKLWTLFSIIKLIQLKFSQHTYDIILSSSPPSAVNLSGLVAKKLFKAKWICDLRDPIIDWTLYPNSVTKARVGIEEWLEKKYLLYSDVILVTTPSYEEELISKLAKKSLDHYKVKLLYNGYDTDYLSDKEINDSFLIVHAGSLYMNRDPFPFLKAIKFINENKLIRKNDLKVCFYGDCKYWNGENLLEWIEEESLSDIVSLHDSVPLEDIKTIYKDADILLAFAQGQPKQIPAKVFEYMGCSARILAISEKSSDTAKLLLYSNIGVVAENKDEIVEKILKIYNNKSLSKSSSDGDGKKAFSRRNQNRLLIKQCEALLYEC